MAQRQVVQLIDDIEGTEVTEGGETILFGVDGVVYEIDLNDKNAKKLRETLDFYVSHARKAAKSESATQKARAKQNRDYDPAAVRAWAQSNKVDVPDRGRIPASVVVQFKEAGN